MNIEDEFTKLYKEYGDRVYRLSYQMLGNKDEAANLTQETFSQVFRHFAEVRGDSHIFTWIHGDSHIFTWIHRINKNLCLRQLQKQARRSFNDLESLIHTVKDESWSENDVSKLAELGEKLQSGKLDGSSIVSTHCLRNDPSVGMAIWEAKNQDAFERAFAPHRAYYSEVMEIEPVILPEEALQVLMKQASVS